MQERILEYMRTHNGITTKQAFELFGCTRLSEYIRRIRLEYNVINEHQTGINRFGKKVWWDLFKLGDKI